MNIRKGVILNKNMALINSLNIYAIILFFFYEYENLKKKKNLNINTKNETNNLFNLYLI